MARVLVSMSVSLDGFAAGPEVSASHPMGKGGERLHEWLLRADPFPADAEQSRELYATTGAVIVGHRTFSVGVDIWEDTPFPVPTFVLTHQPREPMSMKSATFTFVTSGLEDALSQARQAAGERNVLVMGGADTAHQFVQAGLVDEIRIQLVPVLLGSGARLFGRPATGHIELGSPAVVESPHVTHLRFQVGGGLSARLA